jgi:2-hydroxychromene-2-carboxylate isomerase
MVTVDHFTDPGCPWAYSASPALTVLRWRFGDNLRWRLRAITITSSADDYAVRGLDPVRLAQRYVAFRQYGMPFAGVPRPRVVPTAFACRVTAAATLVSERFAEEVLRRLQLAWFTTTLLLDEPAAIAQALAGCDAEHLLAATATAEGKARYDEHYRAARRDISRAAIAQGKTEHDEGPVRYTAPTLVFSADDTTHAVVGGFQPLEAYDVLLANLVPELPRRPAPTSIEEALRAFPQGLTTHELFAVIRSDEIASRTEVESLLVRALAAETVRRVPLGPDALWLAGPSEHARGLDPGPSVR